METRAALRASRLARARELATSASLHQQDLKFFLAQRLAAASSGNVEQVVERLRSKCGAAQSRLDQVCCFAAATTPPPFCWQIHRGLETTPTPLPHDRLTFLEMKESMLKSELEQMRAGIKTEGAERKNE